MLFQLTILQLFSFEDADNSLLEASGKDISIFLIFLFLSIFNFLRCAVSLLFSTYAVFPLIYLLNILQFVLVVDTAADADFCDKSTVFVYINFMRCPILFSFISFLFIYSLKHNNQSVLMVEQIAMIAGAEFCHGDTIFSVAQLVMRTLLFSYLIFLRYDMFFVNQVALFFYLNCLRCVIIHSLECFLYLLRHNNRLVVLVDITPGSEMQVYFYLHFFVNLVNTYHILFSW